LAGWLAPTLTRDAWATRSPGVVPHVSRVLGFLLSASFLARILSALAIVLYLAAMRRTGALESV